MKKILGLLTILAVLAITSCGGSATAPEATGTDSLSVADSTVKADTTEVVADTTKEVKDSIK